jgi:hypothetical protein
MLERLGNDTCAMIKKPDVIVFALLAIFALLLVHVLWEMFFPNRVGFLQLLLSNTLIGNIHLLLLSGLVFLCGFLFRSNSRHTEQLLRRIRNRVNEQFLQIHYEAHIPEHSFDGMSAEIIEDREELAVTDGLIYGLTLTRYARNSKGEYYMFMSNGEDMKIFKHIGHNAAHAILKEKYVAPQQA